MELLCVVDLPADSVNWEVALSITLLVGLVSSPFIQMHICCLPTVGHLEVYHSCIVIPLLAVPTTPPPTKVCVCKITFVKVRLSLFPTFGNYFKRKLVFLCIADNTTLPLCATAFVGFGI